MTILGVPTAERDGDNEVGVSCGSGDCIDVNRCCGCSFLIDLVVVFVAVGLVSLFLLRVSCRCLL